MTQAASVLLAVAAELSELAKNSLPALRKGEMVQREWLEDGSFYRETSLDGLKFIAQFNFQQRRSRRVAVRGGK